MSELWRKTACEMVNLLASDEVRPSEAVEASAQRIEETDGAVNAMVTTCLDRAMENATRIEAKGHPDQPGPGYLYGLPVSVKDLYQVEGVLCTEGSPIFADRISTESDLMVQNLETNGAIVIGKSNTPEFGAGANTFNEVFGATRNPWDTRMTCGGSSGGAAVNLATGQSWLATGSDLGGSLRIPGAFCSIVGFRPSPGRCPRGTSTSTALFGDLGVSGPMARNVNDVALMLDAMVGQYARDPISLPVPTEAFQVAAQRATPPRRIGWSATLGIAPVEPEIAEICAKAAQSFADLGTKVDEACPDFSDAQKMFQTLRGADYVASKKMHMENHRDQLKPTAGFVFRNERGSPVSINGFQKMFGKFSEMRLGVKWNSHSLRHACGTALIDKGHDLRTVQVYMGHRNIQNTTVYLHALVESFNVNIAPPGGNLKEVTKYIKLDAS